MVLAVVMVLACIMVSPRVMVLAVLWWYLLTLIIVLAHIMVLLVVMVLACYIVLPLVMVLSDNPHYGVSPCHGVSTSNYVSC